MRHFNLIKNSLSFLILSIALFATSPSWAGGNMIIIDGKPFSFQPIDVPTCGDLNSPQQSAAMFALSFAQSNGEKTWEAACKAGIQTKCTPDDIKKFGIQMLFVYIRRYESGLTNEACKVVRKECENRCSVSKLFDDRACLIECNQYETWKR